VHNTQRTIDNVRCSSLYVLSNHAWRGAAGTAKRGLVEQKNVSAAHIMRTVQ
jgi:hypothetical protein